MSFAQPVTESQFSKEALEAQVLVLVDFGATWCGPCRRLEPELEAVAEALQGQVKVLKVDVDQSPNLAEQFGIRGVPQMTFIKNGQVVDSMVGLASRNVIAARARQLL